MFIQNWEKDEARKKLERAGIARLAESRRLNALLPMIPALPPEPGVYEEEIHPPGEHWYKIVMPSGAVGVVHFPDELWDEALFPNLQRRFEAKTKRRLQVI